MKSPNLIVAAISLFATSAFAADLPVKAPPAVPFISGYPYGSNGPIFGIFTEVGAGPVNASVPGVNSASLTTTTAGIGAMAGYAWGSKTSQFAYSLEAKVSANNFNGENQGFSVSGPISAEGTAYIWMPVSLIQNVFSILNITNPFSTIAPFPAVTAPVTASNIQAGFGGGFRADDVTIAYLGAGSNKVFAFSPKIEFALMEQLSTGLAVREYTEVIFQNNSAIFGAMQSKATLGPKIMAGVMGVF